jgi:hypothetical protein
VLQFGGCCCPSLSSSFSLPSGSGFFFFSSSRVFVGVGVGVYKMALTVPALSLLYVYFTSYYTSNVYRRSRVRGILHILLICSIIYYSLLRHHI